jgi:DNA-binding LacI/PurR family transcriptional regulator
MSPIRFDEGDGSHILTEHLTDKPHPRIYFRIGPDAGFEGKQAHCPSLLLALRRRQSRPNIDVSGIRHQVNL